MPDRKEPQLLLHEPPPEHDKMPMPTEAPAQEQEEVFSARGARSSAASGRSFPWLAFLALVLALASLAFAGWQWQRAEQQQKVLVSLADRFQAMEVRLSETGQDLNTTGNTFSQQLETLAQNLAQLESRLEEQVAKQIENGLATQAEQLDAADREIRKLWVIAHQRNQPAIAALEETSQALEKSSQALVAQVASVQQTAQQAVRNAAELEQQNNRLAARLDTELQAQKQAQEEVLTDLAAAGKTRSDRLSELSLRASLLSQQLQDQDQRQPVKRLVAALESLQAQVKAQPEQPPVPENLEQRLAEQDEILASLEASRSQLVSRITRLTDALRALQSAN